MRLAVIENNRVIMFRGLLEILQTEMNTQKVLEIV